LPKVKSLLRIPSEYLDTIPVGNQLFSPLYQFENGLRLVVHKHLSDCYGANWWDDKLKYELPKIYEYATEQKAKSEAMPWIGDSPRIKVLPIHRITLGQLEEIVKQFAPDCIPQLFPTLNFFLGHMECIKRVRNMYSHMFPCMDQGDHTLVKREILTLSEHLNSKL
jgi:hypothetical protein